MMSLLARPMTLTILCLMVAGLGTVLLGVLFVRARSLEQMLSLRRHRSTQEGFTDLLNYAALVDDGVIVCKNGSFMAAWLYQGNDNANCTDEEREMVSARINQALAGLGTGWMIHVDATRSHAPGYSEPGLSHFPDPVTKAIDEERRRFFQTLGTMYEACFALTVTWYPPLLAQRRFVELMFDDDREHPDRTDQTHNLIQTFEREVQTIESHLSTVFKMRRLRGRQVQNEDGSTQTHDELLSYLNFCVTGLSHPIQLPSNPIYLDSLIGAREAWGGVIPTIGRKHVQCVAIDGFPLESHPGMLSLLAELPTEYRWSSRFIFLDQHEALAHLNRFRKKWRQKIRGFWDQVFQTNRGSVNRDAAAMVEDAEVAIAEVNSGMVAAGLYTSVVVLMDEERDTLEASARMIEKAINSLGFSARIETINTMDAFLGSLPGHGVENVRRPVLSTMNLADFLPTSTIWTGENLAPCPMYPPSSPAVMQCVTSGHTPFWLNLHTQDLGHADRKSVV